jgi:hypothetical protein
MSAPRGQCQPINVVPLEIPQFCAQKNSWQAPLWWQLFVVRDLRQEAS